VLHLEELASDRVVVISSLQQRVVACRHPKNPGWLRFPIGWRLFTEKLLGRNR